MSFRPAGPTVRYQHLDVFTGEPYAGNAVAVFLDPPSLTVSQMVAITQELRLFETVFVHRTSDNSARARVFDLFAELDFAGHPVLGAAAAMHLERRVPVGEPYEWRFELAAKPVSVTTTQEPSGTVAAILDQGGPEWIAAARPADLAEIATAVGINMDDLDPELLPEVVSTGLAYLIVAVRPGVLERVHIAHPDFVGFLRRFGAQFAYVLDVAAVEGRHWNNDGVIEDVATGSAAGCVVAYLMRHGLASDGVPLSLAQGRFTGRPSHLTVTAFGTGADVTRVTVGGNVSLVAIGELVALPAPTQ